MIIPKTIISTDNSNLEALTKILRFLWTTVCIGEESLKYWHNIAKQNTHAVSMFLYKQADSSIKHFCDKNIYSVG